MPEKTWDLEIMARWALENAPSSKHRYAGRVLIQREFNCSQHAAGQAANLAKQRLRDTTPEEPPSLTEIQLMRELQKMRTKAQRYEELEGVFSRVIAEAVPSLPAFKKGERKLPKLKKGKNPCWLMLDASDWQVGLSVRPEDTLHTGGYNYEIFKDRLRKLRDVLLTVYEEQSLVRPIEGLVVNFIGDLLEGVNIFKGQAWFLDMNLVEQFLHLMVDISQWLRDLSSGIPQVRCLGVWGNHGRVGMKGELPARCNAEYLLLRVVQHMIQQIDGSRLDVSRCPLLAYELLGEIHMLAHGDKTRQWMQVPFYGLTRDTLRYISMTELNVRHMHYGHHHRNANWRESAGHLHLNGSLCGPTAYSVDEIKSAEPASQNLFLVHPEHGLGWRCQVQFSERKPLVPDAQGIFTPVDSQDAIGDDSGTI